MASPEVLVLAPVVPPLSETSKLELVRTQLGVSAFVYHPYSLLRTLSVLRSRVTICLPHDIRSLLRDTYQEGLYKADFDRGEHVDESLAKRAFVDSHRVPDGVLPDSGTEPITDQPEGTTLPGTRKDGVRSSSVVLVRASDMVPLNGGPAIGTQKYEKSSIFHLDKSTVRATDRDGSLAAMGTEVPGIGWLTYVLVDDDGTLIGKDGSRSALRYSTHKGLSR